MLTLPELKTRVLKHFALTYEHEKADFVTDNRNTYVKINLAPGFFEVYISPQPISGNFFTARIDSMGVAAEDSIKSSPHLEEILGWVDTEFVNCLSHFVKHLKTAEIQLLESMVQQEIDSRERHRAEVRR